MADHVQESYTQSVRCLICARPARRGATLCAQCKAAVRRARHTPNVRPEYLPHASVVRTDVRRSIERKVAYSRAVRRASRPVPMAAPGGWGIYATIIAFGLAVCLTGYLAMGENERNFYLGRKAATPAVRADAREDGAANANARVVTPAATAATMPSPAVDAEAFYEPVADEHLALFESLALAPLAIPDRKVARGGRGGRNANAAPGARSARDGVVEPPPTVASLSVAGTGATVAAPESTALDRWQQLAFAQLRCERENVIAGLVCKERARLQYCEGEWGAAPQCPAAVVSLNTR
jgi:hypothetical protein